GTGTFLGSSQPYFLYNQILQTAQVSAAKTWRWNVPASVVTFAFQVLVDAAAPQEHTVLRWLYDPVVDGADLAAVWSASASNAFAVGDAGTILHYNGTTWSAQPSGTGQNFLAVWGSAANDVFAVGDSGRIFHYNGLAWGVQATAIRGNGLRVFFTSVWGSS